MPRVVTCRVILLVALVIFASGCAAPTATTVPEPAIAVPQVIDLSHVVRQDVPYLPAEPHTRLLRDDAGQVQAITIGAQTGTFLQLVAAPESAVQSIEQLSAQDLLLPAVVIDARDHAQDEPTFRLSVDDILAWESEHGRIPAGTIVLLVTGWDVRWGSPDAYLYPVTAGELQAPGFGSETMELLLHERGVAGFGIDGPLLAIEPTERFCLLLANLTSLEQLPPTGATVLIGALKIQAAANAPARVLALLP